MRKKWFIIAALVFLGVVCGALILNTKSHYSSELVLDEMAKHGNVMEMKPIICGVTTSRSPRGYPAVIEKLIDWYYTLRENRKIISTYFIYRRSESDYYSFVIFYGKSDKFFEVEIKPEPGHEQEGLKTQSDLAKAFPKMPCKIITSP